MNVKFRNPEKEVKSFKISFYIEHICLLNLHIFKTQKFIKHFYKNKTFWSTKLVTFFVFSMTILRITVT